MKVTPLIPFTSATLASLLVLGLHSTAAAQHGARPPVRPLAPATHLGPAHPTAQPESRPAPGPKTEANGVKSFRGIASKVGTTPAALEDVFEAARRTNPKLTRGQFIAANVLAQNLGRRHPTITTQAILNGLKSGKSIGQTLQSLGLSRSAAKDAERAADREIKEPDVQGKKESK